MSADDIRRAHLLLRNRVNIQTIARLLHLDESEIYANLTEIKNWKPPEHAIRDAR